MRGPGNKVDFRPIIIQFLPRFPASYFFALPISAMIALVVL